MGTMRGSRIAIGLDIDGVIGPLGPGREGDQYVSGGWNSTAIRSGTSEILRRLADLGDLAWYTSWQEEAHALESVLGLPRLDVVPMGDEDGAAEAKLDGLRSWSRLADFDLMLVLDDEEPESSPPANVAFLHVDPAVGISDREVDRVADAIVSAGRNRGL